MVVVVGFSDHSIMAITFYQEQVRVINALLAGITDEIAVCTVDGP